MIAGVEIAFCGDDALNIHSVFSLLLKPAETASASSAGGNVSNDKLYIIDAGLPAADSFNARPGDTVQFYDIQKVTLAGEAVVASMEQVSDTVVLVEAAQAMGDVNGQCASGCGLFNCSGICGFHFNVNRVWKVTFTEALPAQLKVFDLVQVKGRSADGAVVRNCHFHDAYDGVMQLRSASAVIEGNLFERAHTMSVATAKSWLEGAAGLHGVSARDNVFKGCCTPKSAMGEVVCDPIVMSDCKECTVTNNSFTPSWL